jgi:hypothetical protein
MSKMTPSILRSRLLIELIVTGSSRSSCDDGVYDRECHAAQIDIFIASYDLIYLPFPVGEPLLGMGHESVGVGESRFELPDPP